VTEFGKLVRDRIPEIIEADGRRPVVEVLDVARYREALLAKLGEEAAELAAADEDGVLDELADVYEVLRALAEQAGVDLDQVEERADVKGDERGRFRDRLYLVRVEP
jgi:predicted house-cleaning noncanonical NTP pyrophosphatase (MazG superfamily)